VGVQFKGSVFFRTTLWRRRRRSIDRLVQTRGIRRISYCPAVVIGICGPHVIFSAAVSPHDLVSERFADYIFLEPRAGEGLDNAIMHIAHMIYAMNNLLDAIKANYKLLKLQTRRDARKQFKLLAGDPPPFPGPAFLPPSRGRTRCTHSNTTRAWTWVSRPDPSFALV
jgi:hypothetical protein